MIRPPFGPPPRPLRPSAPGPELYEQWRRDDLFARRVVWVDGHLDDVAAGRIASEALLLDAAGDDTIRLRANSGTGTIGAGLVLLDALDTVGVDVEATVVGAAEGPALWAVAVCDRRIAVPHARLRLSATPSTYEIDARSMAAAAEQHGRDLDAVASRLAEITGLDPDAVRPRLDRDNYLTPDDAIQLHLLDEVATPEARILPFPRKVGFHLR